MKSSLQRKFLEVWRERKPEIFCGAICVLAVIGLIRILVGRYLYVESKNAVVNAYAVPLAFQVSGEITDVLVEENQRVRAGQVLSRIDDRPYRYELIRQMGLRDAIHARWSAAQRDLARARYFLKNRVIDASRFDQAVAAERNLEHLLAGAQAMVAISELNVGRTRLVAPQDGIIGFRSARRGMYASVGFPVFGFIADQRKWVAAKIKEADLAAIRVGDPVIIRLDADPGHRYTGRVESIAPASEASFAAVPDDFAAGNYTKYAQWFPVRISLDPGARAQPGIPIGTGSEIWIRRRHGSA
jgi:multidrug resistance efflux pump